MQEDPMIKAIEDGLTELEDHIRANRANTEQGLYTEALPRIINLFRGFLDAIDSEPPETIHQEGALVAIRYQTANSLELVLTELFSENQENEALAAALFFLLEDLHGISEEDAVKAIQEKGAEEDETPKDQEPPKEPPQ